MNKYNDQNNSERLNNPVYHIHNGSPLIFDTPLTFSLILNLVNASQADNKETLWGFIREYIGDISGDSEAYIDRLLDYAISYFNDFILPTKKYKIPNDSEVASLERLLSQLKNLEDDVDVETIQTVFYDIGKEANYENLREWFLVLYQILLGQDQGPRLGSFAKLYGLDKTCNLIESAISKNLA